MAVTETDGRRFLDPRTLTKVGRLDIIARLIVEGFISGLHRSPYHGFSVEFAEHREYVPGDDLKHLDWKVYGRSDRYYVKEYEEETNLKSYLVLDTSESMRYRGGDGPTKFEYGCFVAASLAHLLLRQQDSVGLVLFDSAIQRFIPPQAHPGHMNVLLKELDQVVPREKTDVAGVLHALAERVRKKGLIVIISDLFDDPDRLLGSLAHLRHRRHEVIVFHLLDHDEATFPFDRMTMFEGMEGHRDLLADPLSLRRAYLAELDTFRDRLKRGCRQERIDFTPMDTATSLDVALTSYLANRASRAGR